MSSFHTIKQLEERNVPNEINFMVWSDKMDLIAFSNIKGEVALHRLTWSRAWSLSPPKDGLVVTYMAWRPDGKVLAVAYCSGETVLISVENKETLNEQDIKQEITCMTWVQEKLEYPPKDTFNFKDDKPNDYMKYIDMSKLYLRDPTPPAHNNGHSEDRKESYFLQEQTELNLLVIGTKDGFVHIRIFGTFTCAILNIKQYLGEACSVEHVRVSEDLSRIFVVVKDENSYVKVVTVDSSIFKSHARELFAVAMKFVKLTDITAYISNAIASITETWESFLLEIDHKLSRYSKKVPRGGITADFLDLLIFGVCSPELQEFLMHDLTKKGLEKFGQTIEMSYANIQKLLLKSVTKYGQNLTFQLAELRGMARFDYKYEIVGLSIDEITLAIQSCGAFLIKAGEIQQIINHSVINYKAFFRWLYGAILTLMEENVPGEIHRMTQQDVAYITEFIQNFDRVGGNDNGKGGNFVMEQIGQYLADEPLSSAPIVGAADGWQAFLDENQCLQEHPAILKREKDSSLVQQFKDVAAKVTDIFITPCEAMSRRFPMLRALEIYKCETLNRLNVTSINTGCKDGVRFAFDHPTPFDDTCVLFVQLEGTIETVRTGRMSFSPRRVLDLQFYSSAVLTVLLEDYAASSPTSLLLQLPLAACDDETGNGLSEVGLTGGLLGGPLIAPDAASVPAAKDVRIRAVKVAVSGSRRVGAVLADNGRKVKLFEMEAEEEEDEDATGVTGVSSADCSDAKDVDMKDETAEEERGED